MNAIITLVVMSFRDAWRSHWTAGLMIGIALIGELLIRFSGGGATTLVSLLDVALLVAPLAGLVLGTLQVHNARELTELLLAQPIRRDRLFIASFVGTTAPLAVAIMLGLVAPFAWHRLLTGQVVALAAAAGMLVLVSTALAFVIGLRVDDRVRALGIAIGAWLAAAVLWDGVILLVALMFGSGPVEGPMIAMLALNPLDIARVLLILGSDAAALLGYTGATLQHLLGSTTGRLAMMVALLTWMVIPLWFARRTFVRKDF